MTLVWKQRPARADMTARSAATNDNTTTCGGGRELYWRWQVLTACISTRRPPGVDRSGGELEREQNYLSWTNEWTKTWQHGQHIIITYTTASEPGGLAGQAGGWIDMFVIAVHINSHGCYLTNIGQPINITNSQWKHTYTQVSPPDTGKSCSQRQRPPPSPHLQCPD